MLSAVTKSPATKMNSENLLTCLNPSLQFPNELFRVLIIYYDFIFSN